MRKAWGALAAALFLAAVVLFVEGCTAQQIKDNADKVQYLLGSAAPLIPPPFGLIAGGLASLAGVVSSVAAGKAKQAAIIADEDAHPIATFLSDHHYLYPALAALLGFLQSSHVINIGGDQLAAIMGAIGLPPTLAQVIWSRKADAATPAPVESPPMLSTSNPPVTPPTP